MENRISDIPVKILTGAILQQLERKLQEACRIGYAEITLVVEKGRLRWIRGPAPSEPVARDG